MSGERRAVLWLTLTGAALLAAACGDSVVEAATAITCTAAVDHGEPVTCSAEGAPADAMIDWGDGTTDFVGESGSATHSYAEVGRYQPVLAQNDATLRANQVEVAPLLSVACEEQIVRVWDITEVVGSVSGWDYAPDATVEELDGATRCTPSVGGGTSETKVTWAVEPVGAAGNAGSLTGVGVAGDEVAYDWDGHQPATATFTVVVNGVSADISTMMYLSGCG